MTDMSAGVVALAAEVQVLRRKLAVAEARIAQKDVVIQEQAALLKRVECELVDMRGSLSKLFPPVKQ